VFRTSFCYQAREIVGTNSGLDLYQSFEEYFAMLTLHFCVQMNTISLVLSREVAVGNSSNFRKHDVCAQNETSSLAIMWEMSWLSICARFGPKQVEIGENNLFFVSRQYFSQMAALKTNQHQDSRVRRWQIIPLIL